MEVLEDLAKPAHFSRAPGLWLPMVVAHVLAM